MFFENISYVPAVIGAVLAMGFGFVWYSPVAFANRWMKEMNYTPEGLEELKNRNSKSGMVRTFSISIVVTLVSSIVIAALLNSLVITSFSGLFLFGFFLWLALSMPVALNAVLFGKDSFMLFAINSGYQLVTIVILTLINGIWG